MHKNYTNLHIFTQKYAKFINTIVKYMKNFTNIMHLLEKHIYFLKIIVKYLETYNYHINSHIHFCGIEQTFVYVLATVEVGIITLLTNCLVGITG